MQKELLSAYIDGENVSNELMEKLCQDEALQQSWANFHVIRAVMRQESDVLLGTDFTAKMEVLIAQEETAVAKPIVSQPIPAEVEKLPFMQKFKSLWAPMVQVAVAASVCLVAVFGVQSFNATDNASSTVDNPVLQTLPFNNSVQEVSYNAPTRDVVTAEQIEQKKRQISSMLQNYELQRRVYADDLSLNRHGK